MNISLTDFQRLVTIAVDAGLVTPIKKGKARNAAVWYSLTEIKKAWLVVELKKKDNDNS